MAIRGGFQIAEAYVELILDKDPAKRGLRSLPREMGPDADRSGREVGNTLSRGIRLSMIRNSPLIASVIAGALAAGAPLLLASATLLFAGIGAAAAAQSQQVKSAWQGLWDYVKTSSQQDAAILVPTFVNMAHRIADSFEAMRPAMREAFGAIGPQIDILTTSLTRMTETIVGGLTRAVKTAGPVMVGFGKFLESTGTGLAAMFDAMSTHSAAAGSSFQSLGTIVGTLLPILGELLGQGVEVASTMLPLLGGSLKVVLGVLQLLGPALPPLVTAFSGFKVAQLAAGYMTKFAQSMAFASYGTGPFAGAMGVASSAASGLGRALPLIGIAVGVISSAMQESANRTNEFAQGILAGGSAATQAYKEMGNPSFWDKYLFNLTHWGNTQKVGVAQTKEAQQAARDYLAALTPLGRAQHEQQVAQAEVNEAIDLYGEKSVQANSAQEAFERASAKVEDQLAAEQRQLKGVTDAMIEMGEQAMAQADASYALRKAHKDVADAVKEVQDLEAQGIHSGEEYTAATWKREEAIYAEVAAARKLAEQALPAVMDADERKAASDMAALERLKALEEQYGALPPILQTLKADLERSTAGMDTTKIASDALAATLRDVGLTVTQIPDSKTVRITAPSDEVKAKLDELGFTIKDIPGTADVFISADTDTAQGLLKDLSGLLQGLDGTTATPTVAPDNITPAKVALDDVMESLGLIDGYKAEPTIDPNTDGFQSDIPGIDAWLFDIDGYTAEPTVDLNDEPFIGPVQSDEDRLAGLDDFEAQPSASLDDVPLIGGLFTAAALLTKVDQTEVIPTGLWNGNALSSGIRGSTSDLQFLDDFMATPTAQLNNVPLIGAAIAATGKLAALGAQRPTPVSNINNIPLIGAAITATGKLAALGAQRPTPTALLNKNVFDGTYSVIWRLIDVLGARVVMPRVILQPVTSIAEAALNYAARTRYSTVYQTMVPAAAGGGHVGDIVSGIRRFAGGGRPGGRIVGPGGMFDDLVAAVTDGGEPIRVSNDEWIVPGLPAQRYGPAKMRSIVDGSAVVLTPGELRTLLGARGFVDGGDVGATVTRTATGATVTIGELHLHIQGIFDLTKPAEVRRLGLAVREAIRGVERETS